jgi:hypothetical protein
MALSPVIVRELRAESRRPFSYWLRVLGAAVQASLAILATSWLCLSLRQMAGNRMSR